MLVQWSEVFRNGLISRSKVLLAVDRDKGPTAAGDHWLALVAWRPIGPALRAALPASLRHDCRVPSATAASQSGSVGDIFRQMESAGQTVWFLNLRQWGGAAIFIRKAASDPALAKILMFNRQGRPSLNWQLPRHRSYPHALRTAYAKQWCETYASRIASRRRAPSRAATDEVHSNLRRVDK